MSGFFHSAWYLWDSPTFLPVFLFIVEYYPHGIDVPLFVYPFTSWWAFYFFHFLTFINNATTNIQVEDFVVYVFTSLGQSLGEDLLSQEVNASLFKKLPNCFPVAVYLCIPTRNTWEFWLVHILPNISSGFCI